MLMLHQFDPKSRLITEILLTGLNLWARNRLESGQGVIRFSSPSSRTGEGWGLGD